MGFQAYRVRMKNKSRKTTRLQMPRSRASLKMAMSPL